MADSVSATVTLYSGFPRDQGLLRTKNMLPGSVIRPKAGHTRVPLRQATGGSNGPRPHKGRVEVCEEDAFGTESNLLHTRVQSSSYCSKQGHLGPGASRSVKMK